MYCEVGHKGYNYLFYSSNGDKLSSLCCQYVVTMYRISTEKLCAVLIQNHTWWLGWAYNRIGVRHIFNFKITSSTNNGNVIPSLINEIKQTSK